MAGAACYQSIGVVVAPRELEVSTKTKVHDDTVFVDSACRPACGDMLRELVRIRTEGDRLFPHLALKSYEKALRDLSKDLTIAELEITHTLSGILAVQMTCIMSVARFSQWPSEAAGPTSSQSKDIRKAAVFSKFGGKFQQQTDLHGREQRQTQVL